MAWTKPTFERSEYNAAGRTIILDELDLDDWQKAIHIVSNWRSSHAYPLHAIAMSLRSRVNRIDAGAPVVRRLKRLASIMPKLERMNLTQIQDIGGCRAVLRDMRHLRKVEAIYLAARQNTDRRRPYLNKEPSHYINEPKADGYRGIHLVYRYRSEQEKHQAYNEMKIEIQLRTKAQHSWATAVEVVDLFTGQGLKGDLWRNQADPTWKRFFALMSSWIAIEEACPVVPDTPTRIRSLLSELRDLALDLNAHSVLTGYGRAIQHAFNIPNDRGGAFLIVIDSTRRTLRVRPYRASELDEAEREYLAMEQRYLRRPQVQVAQVHARSFSEFKRAYPNYVVDTTNFVQALQRAIPAIPREVRI